MYIFKINGTAVSDPLEWADFTETLEYDKQVNGILMKYNQKFTFVKDGYEYISNYLANNGYCNKLPITVLFKCTDGTYDIILDGFIFLSEAKFNRSKCTVEVEFEDNSFTSKIYANRGIKTYINADRSKNGTAITPATKISIGMANPFTSQINYYWREGYDLKEVFRYLIDFMTDGTVGFVSDWYDNLPVADKILVTTGSLIRLTGTNTKHDPPNISFQETFEEVRKKFNIAFAVEKDTSGNPQIRIENFDYFKDNVNQSTIVYNIPELIESFDSDMFYAQVNIGSNAIPLPNINIGQFALWPYPFVTFQKEEYFVQGECNTDEELNLVSDWVIDSNIIQGLTLTDTANTDYDAKNIFIQYDSSNMWATLWNTIDYGINNPYPNRMYYNEIFTNALVAGRFNLQGNISKNIGSPAPLFYATKVYPEALKSHTGTSIGQSFSDVYTDVEFANDSIAPAYDPGNNYDNTTYRFKAPISGLYSFYQSWTVFVSRSDIYNNGIMSYAYWTLEYARCRFRKYSSTGVFLAEFADDQVYDLYNLNGSKTGLRKFESTNSMYLQAGEMVSVKITIDGSYTSSFPLITGKVIEYAISAQDGVFKLITSATGGGIYGQSKDPDNYYTSVYEFEQVLSESEWAAIKANPQNYIRFSMNSNQGQKGWLRKIERNKATGLTKFSLTSKFNNQ
jgi:hypothetical protein